MRLASIQVGQQQVAAIVFANDSALPVSELNQLYGTQWETDLFTILRAGQLDDLKKWFAGLSRSSKETLFARATPTEQIVYGPLYKHPAKIWGIGLNYVEHASDLKEISPSEEPASFMKPDTTIIGPGDKIILPEQSSRVTSEAELGLVIGHEVKNIAVQEAPSVVAGLTTVIDVTAEDILEKNPRYLTLAKSFDTFFSFGPHLVTLDEVNRIDELKVSTVINGRQHRTNRISNMTFSPWFLVSFHSRVMTLLPGDIISTGTPGAVVIREGDTVGCEIEGFEALTNLVGR